QRVVPGCFQGDRGLERGRPLHVHPYPRIRQPRGRGRLETRAKTWRDKNSFAQRVLLQNPGPHPGGRETNREGGRSMKRSPLHEDHAKRGAVFLEQSGWEIPAHYGDPSAGYSAVRNAVGIMDLSSRGKIRVTGEDRVKWLQSIISNDILPLTPGQGIYSTFLTHKGKIIAYFRVYQLGDALMLEDVGETGDTTFATLRKFLLFGTKAKMENCGETWGLLLISGPKALELIRSTFGTDLSSLKPLAFEKLEIDGSPALLIRSEETGETDIEILVPSGGLRSAWERLWTAGDSMGLQPFGAHALETLRVEAGLPKMGLDLNENIVPPEAN